MAEIRANALAMEGIEGQRLRLVARLVDQVEADARAMLGSLPRVPGAPKDHEVIESAVVAEMQAVLGIAQSPACRLVNLAQRLTRVLPEVLVALESGRLDLIRARVLAQATEVLSDAAAREVAQEMLAVAGDCPWEGLSPRSWRARTDRMVVQVDADAARRRRKEAYQRRAVRSWPTAEGMAELFITADAADIAMAEQVLTDLARACPAAGDPGEVRGPGGPAPLDPVTARERAHALVRKVAGPSTGTVGDATSGNVRETDGGADAGTSTDIDCGTSTDLVAGTCTDLVGPTLGGVVGGRSVGPWAATSGRAGAVNVLLVDSRGVLRRVVRLPRAPAGGWTRQLLDAAVMARFDELPPLRCDGYVATAATVTTCGRVIPDVLATTVRAVRALVIWIMTRRGRGGRPMWRTSPHGADDTTSTRHAAWSARSCTATGRSTRAC